MNSAVATSSVANDIIAIYSSVLIVYLGIALIFNLICAFLFADIAVKKGYKSAPTFCAVLFLGIIGIIYACALPNKNKF